MFLSHYPPIVSLLPVCVNSGIDIQICSSECTLMYVGSSSCGSASCCGKGEAATEDVLVQSPYLDFTSDAYELSPGTYKKKKTYQSVGSSVRKSLCTCPSNFIVKSEIHNRREAYYLLTGKLKCNRPNTEMR